MKQPRRSPRQQPQYRDLEAEHTQQDALAKAQADDEQLGCRAKPKQRISIGCPVDRCACRSVVAVLLQLRGAYGHPHFRRPFQPDVGAAADRFRAWRRVIRGLARLAVLATAIPALLISLAYQSGAIDTWWIELLHYVPYPMYLLPALIALGLSFALRWAWRAIASTTVLLVLTVIMGLVVGRSDRGTLPLRVMTYNVKAYHASKDFEEITREVQRHNPDILVMQDARELAAQPTRRLDNLYGGRYAYEHGQYIVLSRFPLSDCRPHAMPLPEQVTDYVRCFVTVAGIDVDLVAAHFLSPRGGLNATRRELADGIDDWRQNFAGRQAQARRIADDLGGSPRPLIVAGDLNAAERSPVVRVLLATGLRDAFSSAGIGYGYTHGHALKVGFSFLRIDHVLVSSEIGVVDAYSGGWQASEHRPVIADLVLQRVPR